jgi:hypothetical protein
MKLHIEVFVTICSYLQNVKTNVSSAKRKRPKVNIEKKRDLIFQVSPFIICLERFYRMRYPIALSKIKMLKRIASYFLRVGMLFLLIQVCDYG